MKRTWPPILAALLAVVLLAGCATPPAAEVTATVSPAPTTTPTTAPTTASTTAPAATESTAPFAITITPVITTEQTTVTVRTVDELIAAIAPDTEIILDAPQFDLPTATGYGEDRGEYYRWDDPFDGPELVIVGVSNLTIRGSGDDRTAHEIRALPRYAHIFNFENCSNIHLSGFTAGHYKEAPGSCMGGVTRFQNCQNILIENCGLYGCGTWGVSGLKSKDMQIVSNDIYECSVCGVYLDTCQNVSIDGNTFRDLGDPEHPDWGADDLRLYSCSNVTRDGIESPSN